MNRSIFAFVLIMLASCTTTRYYTDRLVDSAVPAFRTYSVEGHCDEELSPISVIRLENAVHMVLRDKGFTRSDDPDIIVQAFLKNKDMMMLSQCNPYDRWEGGEQCEFNYFNYEEGTLILDLIDNHNNEIFWHGAAVGTSFKYSKQPDERILKLVTRLFDDYFKEVKPSGSDVVGRLN